MARIKLYNDELIYRNYISDSLFYLAQNRGLTIRYHDLLDRKADNRSGDEIAQDVIHRLGLKV